jgi:hypothetical protein
MILARPIPLPHDPRRYLLQRDREIPIDMVPRLMHPAGRLGPGNDLRRAVALELRGPATKPRPVET